jgi:ABC-type phosphate/phosphonate transport system permease subunit
MQSFRFKAGKLAFDLQTRKYHPVLWTWKLQSTSKALMDDFNMSIITTKLTVFLGISFGLTLQLLGHG